MNLILTFDYELYGDGSGNVFEHVIKPTNQILNICEKFNVKTTIFFEVLEYIKLKEEWTSGNQMGYTQNPIDAIETQLITAAKNGHDIQLHLHPQWANAKYTEDGWFVDQSRWRLGDFKSTENHTIISLLKIGKEVIENLLKPVVKGYECCILRAGGYNVLPSKKVYKAMKKVGLKFDSSVYPGGYEYGKLSKYDYRKAPLNLDYWNVNADNFSQEGTDEIIEIPVFALPVRRLRKINVNRIKSFLRNRKSATNLIQSKSESISLTEKISFWLDKEALTWDFCLFDFGLHKNFFKYIERELNDSRSSFVLIGHPKGFTVAKSFTKMLLLASKKYKFLTLKEYSDSISE